MDNHGRKRSQSGANANCDQYQKKDGESVSETKKGCCPVLGANARLLVS